MRRSLVRYWRFFSLGFIVAFVAYLFIRWDAEKVFTGVGVAAVAGLILVVAVEYVRYRTSREEGVVEAER